MNLTKLIALLLVALAPAFAVSQAKPKEDTSATDADEKRNTSTFETTAPAADIHTAALEALAKIGCNIKKDSPASIEGKRPNKIGLAVGSGGEKLFVTIKPIADGKHQVTVKTKKTPMGIVGQKLWNEEVAADIQAILQKA